MQDSQPESFIVTIIPETPAPETTVADVIIGAFGVTGVLVVLALVLGVVVGAIRLRWNRAHPPSDDHMPPVAPLTPDGPTSSRVRPTS